MNQQKQIIIIGITFIFVISVLFFNIKDKFKEEHQITEKEIQGIHQITTIFELEFIIKSIRGIIQINKKEALSLRKNLFENNTTILHSIKKLDNKEIEKFYHDITNKNNSKTEMLTNYTKILKSLATERINIADDSYLLFERDRTIYFLMTTTILAIPNISEDVGQIGLTGLEMLNSDKDINKISFLRDRNIKSIMEKIEDIKFTINKIDDNQKVKFESLLNTIVTDVYTMKSNLERIQKNNSTINSKLYFHETSKLENQLRDLFYLSKEILTKKLQDREYELSNKLLMGTVFYILLLSSSLIIAYIMYRKYERDLQESKKKKEHNDFIQLIQEDFIKNNNLKVICNKSLNHIINYFGAVNGSLYLYNKQNEKLYLFANYGIKHNNLNSSLDLHENIISENILEKKIKTLDVDKKVSLGNIEIDCDKLLTIPIIAFKNSIGTIQLLFSKKTKEIDLEFLQTVISLMGTYINKAQKDEESSKYLKLIDKNVLMSKTDLDGNIIEVSQQLCQLSQYDKQELIGKSHRIFRHSDMEKEVFIELWETLKKGENWIGEIKNKTKYNDYYWLETFISPDYDMNHNIVGYTAIRTNITDKKRIEQIAITDGLTDLYNRRHFDSIFPQQIERNKRNQELISFLIIDIDYFKQYNDMYGHQEGDNVLKAVSKTLKIILKRPDDYAFRLGGEEFGLIYHTDNEKNAIIIADKVIQSIEQLKIKHLKNKASEYVTISAGLYIITNHDDTTVHEIYKASDKALYKAKENGRNQLSIVN